MANHSKVSAAKSNFKYQQKKRRELFTLLGDRCVICGFTDTRALQLDHKFGGGTQELIKFKGNWQLYNYYLKNPELAKERLQILCANHNWIKRHENKELVRHG
jgi:hypothetical protein